MNKTTHRPIQPTATVFRRSRKYLIALLLTFSTAISAQADDFGLWTSAQASQDLGNTGLSVEGDLGFRLGNHWKNVDRWDAGIGLSYDVTPFLKLGGGYSFIYNYSNAEKKDHYNSSNVWNGYNVENSYWRTKNRFYFEAKGKVEVGRFTFSLRERYQSTIFNHTYTRQDKYRYNIINDADGNKSYLLREGYPESEQELKRHKTTHYLRSRLQAEYNIRHCPVTPYVSFELSNSLTNGFSIDKRRLCVGGDWKIVKGQHLTVGYVYNNGNDDDNEDQLHAIEIGYSIKGLFSK
jgi:hypothetical protein